MTPNDCESSDLALISAPFAASSFESSRSAAVRDYLVGRGVNANRLQTVSYGEERPRHDNSREETRRLNRRAAMTIRLQ